MPAGRIASGVSEPASASMQRWTMPSPPQTKISSAPSSSARFTCFGREPALRHLEPERIVDALTLELPPELGQAAAERLAGVRDDGDLGHFAALRASREPTCEARLTSTMARTAPRCR